MNWFWDNIHLKKEDRAGMFTFLSILFLILLAKWYLVVFYKPQIDNYKEDPFANIEYTIVESPPRKDISKRQSYTSTKINNRKSKPKQKQKFPAKETVKRSLRFDFDPNKMSKDSLLLLGLSTYATNNIEKYRAKGGRFKKAIDLQKIYGVDDELYKDIEPYIKIKKNDSPFSTRKINEGLWSNNKHEPTLHSIDINLADTTEFKSLKGIGSVYANRIVKFRNSLGGYFTIDQIKDVWGVSDSLFVAIEPYLILDVSQIEKKNINTLEKEVLVKHPYINWKKAKAILSYKKMHGDYKSMNDFEKLHGLDQSFVDTLRQYFVAQ